MAAMAAAAAAGLLAGGSVEYDARIATTSAIITAVVTERFRRRRWLAAVRDALCYMS